jgi:hypothetical protein
MVRRPRPSQSSRPAQRPRPKPAYLTLPEYPCCRLPNQPQYPHCLLPVPPPRRRRFSWRGVVMNILALLLLSGMTLGIGGGLWLAVTLMIDPDSVTAQQWLQRLLPNPDPGSHRPQTVAEIQADVHQRDRHLGSPILLPSHGDITPWLLPVTVPLPQCQNQGMPPLVPLSDRPAHPWAGLETLPPDCQQVVELRLYQALPRSPGQPPRYELLHQLSLGGTPEFRVAEFYRHSARSTGSNAALPFTQVNFLGGRPADATGPIWLTAQGQWVRGSNRASHGQLIHYDAVRQRLQASVGWVSPLTQVPTWQDINGNGQVELVVNQTVGLEPAFEVFYHPPDRPLPQLQAVSFLDAASDHPAYTQALALAQAKLWTPALEHMQRAQAAESAQGTWSAAAQLQQDVIALHARTAQAQANRVWSNAGQQLTAYLADGQWAIALDFFDAQVAEHRTDLRQALGATSLWQRINTALGLMPEDEDIQLWATLTLAVRRDSPTAARWWHSQQVGQPVSTAPLPPLPPPVRQRLLALNPGSLGSPPSATAPPPAPPPTAPSLTLAILGGAQATTLADWGRGVTANGAAYAITLTALHDGTQWQRSPQIPAADAPAWPSANPLHLLHWPSPQSLDALFQAPQRSLARIVDVDTSRDRLLAVVEGSAPTHTYPLAVTADRLSSYRPTMTSLAQLRQTAPAWAAALEQHLEAALQQSIETLTDPVPLAELRLDDQTRAVVLRLSPETGATLQPPPTATYTLVVSDRGTLLYQETSGKTSDTLVAIAQLAGEPPRLVIDQGNRYVLRSMLAQGLE